MSSYDPVGHVWSGPHLQLAFDTDRSLGDVLLELLGRNPDKVIQIDGDTDRKMTRREMRMQAIRIAQHLSEDYGCGRDRDEVVSIVALNSDNLIPLVVALQCIAVPFTPLNPHYTANDMVPIMRNTQSRIIFCDAEFYSNVREAAGKAIQGDFKIFILDGEVEDVASVEELTTETGHEEQFIPAKLEDSSKAIYSILYSSGTSGPPKGVCLSHAKKLSIFLPRDPTNSVFFAMGTISWISTVSTQYSAFFYDGAFVYTRRPFSEDLIFDLIEKYKVSHFNGPPIFAHRVVNHPRAKLADLSSMQLWGIGGYYVPDGVRDALDAFLPNGKSFTVYASTECGVIATDMLERRKGAVGNIVPNTQVRIVDDEGRPVGTGERGEVVIKQTVPFLGYFNQKQATEAAFDADGWFQTGDIGFFDEEGYLYLVDRKSELFKCIYTVSPTELETLIAQLDGVKQVCVVGIADENKVMDLPTAVVVRETNSQVSAEEIVDYVAQRVMDHKKLRGGVHFVDHLPVTNKGNVKRKDVKQIITNFKCEESTRQ